MSDFNNTLIMAAAAIVGVYIGSLILETPSIEDIEIIIDEEKLKGEPLKEEKLKGEPLKKSNLKRNGLIAAALAGAFTIAYKIGRSIDRSKQAQAKAKAEEEEVNIIKAEFEGKTLQDLQREMGGNEIPKN
jgi:hypothetical protein